MSKVKHQVDESVTAVTVESQRMIKSSIIDRELNKHGMGRYQWYVPLSEIPQRLNSHRHRLVKYQVDLGNLRDRLLLGCDVGSGIYTRVVQRAAGVRIFRQGIRATLFCVLWWCSCGRLHVGCIGRRCRFVSNPTIVRLPFILKLLYF